VSSSEPIRKKPYLQKAPYLQTAMEEIYLDNHATTAVDPRVIDAMVPLMHSLYANPGSVTHEAGRRAAFIVDQNKARILELLGAPEAELIFTSGATESINLALLGLCLHPRQKKRRVLVGSIDHRAVLDCGKRLSRSGFDVVSIQPTPSGSYDLDSLSGYLDDDVAIVSLILGNNEIGTLQDMHAIAQRCQFHGAALHLDATQALGKIPIDLRSIGADLVSFSAHKFYGPKGIGGLLVGNPDLRISPIIVGGGHQNNLRSGTLNTPGIVGMCRALEIALEELPRELRHTAELRNRLWSKLDQGIEGLKINGPTWSEKIPTEFSTITRLPGNLNIQFPKVDGQSLMLKLPHLAISSGSACTSAEPHPSHVLLGIGVSEDQARCSLRFGIGRFNTEEQMDVASDQILAAYQELFQFLG
jgi:cysteine desulfurase